MKKFLILGAFVVVGAIAGGSAYYLTRASALPAWYRETGTAIAADTASSSDLLAAKLASGEGVRYLDSSRVEITLSETELNQVIMTAIADNIEAARWLQSAQGTNTTISEDRIESGVVINLATLSPDQLPVGGRQVIGQITERFPALADRDIYLGIEGSPSIVEGRLILNDDIRIKIGNIRLTVDQIANQLGLSTSQLEEQLNLTLSQGGITLDGIEFVHGEAVLSGLVE